MTLQEQFQREVYQALLNEALGPWVAVPVERLKSAIPSILAATAHAARAHGVPDEVIDMASRSFLATLRVGGQLVFPGL